MLGISDHLAEELAAAVEVDLPMAVEFNKQHKTAPQIVALVAVVVVKLGKM